MGRVNNYIYFCSLKSSRILTFLQKCSCDLILTSFFLHFIHILHFFLYTVKRTITGRGFTFLLHYFFHHDVLSEY